jgi:DNA polymerase-3 subunit gamma/tau
MFGLAAQSQILGLSKAILAGEIQTALTLLNELSQNGKDLGRLLSDLLNYFRNLLLFQVSRGDLNLLEVSEAEVAALKEQNALANTDSLTRVLEVLSDAELRLRDTASKKILLEVTALKAIEARSAISIDSVLKQLNQLRGGQSSAAVPPAPVPVTANVNSRTDQPVENSPAKNPPTHVGGYNFAETSPIAADLSVLWTQLIEAVGRVSPFTRSYLVDANPLSFVKNVLIIGFDPEFEDHLGLVDVPRNHTLLQTKLAELGHANCQIKFIKAEAPIGEKIKPAATALVAPVATPQTIPAGAKPFATAPAEKKSATVPFNKETFKNDPLIQKALEIFKGQIVEVRA